MPLQMFVYPVNSSAAIPAGIHQICPDQPQNRLARSRELISAKRDAMDQGLDRGDAEVSFQANSRVVPFPDRGVLVGFSAAFLVLFFFVPMGSILVCDVLTKRASIQLGDIWQPLSSRFSRQPYPLF